MKYLSSEITHSTETYWQKIPFQLSDLFWEQENPLSSSEATGLRKIPGKATAAPTGCIQTAHGARCPEEHWRGRGREGGGSLRE